MERHDQSRGGVMRILTIVLCGLLTTPFLHAQQSVARSADEAAVREVVAKYTAARELRDAAAIEALFTPDADQHTTSGEWRRGRAQIVPGTLQSSERNQGVRTIRIESVRFLTSDVAIADGPYEIRAAGGAAPRRMWTSIVLIKSSGGWRIGAIRNMVPTSARPSPYNPQQPIPPSEFNS
jgi:uncharacterized protein (TIGR02246 family)